MTPSWLDTTLGDIAEIVSGATPMTSVEEYWDGGIPWATPKDLSGLDGKFIESTPRTLSTSGLKSCAATLLPAQSVLLSSRAPIGHVAINSVPMATNQGFKNLIPDTARVDSKFLYWWLRFHRPRLEAMGNGATFKEVSKKIVAGVRIQLPPLGEQRRIATVLDAAEALRVKRRKVNARLESLLHTMFLAMFDSGGWDTWTASPVAELAASHKGSIRTGPFGSQLLHEEFREDGPVAVLGIDNAVENRFVWAERRFITEDKYRQLKRFTVRPGDVLITIMGTCGRVAIVPDDIPLAINTKHLCCVTLDKSRCLPEYFWAALRFHPRVLRQLGATHGAVMPGLNMGLIKQAEIPVPPIEVQEGYARAKANVDLLAHKSNGHQALLEDLFQSLQQRAFRGEL